MGAEHGSLEDGTSGFWSGSFFIMGDCSDYMNLIMDVAGKMVRYGISGSPI